MSIDNFTIAEENHGYCIVVLDKGFVYVGTLITGAKFITIENAQCVRRWGTTKGLGQLALEGPQSNTRLDDACTVRAPEGELKHFIICEGESWKNRK